MDTHKGILWRIRAQIRRCRRNIKVVSRRLYLKALAKGRRAYYGLFEAPTMAIDKLVGWLLKFFRWRPFGRKNWVGRPLERIVFQDFRRSCISRVEADPAHESLSKNLSLTSIALVVFCLFCTITLMVPDAVVIARNATIALPFANVDVPFGVFLIVAPIMLVAMLMFLQILAGQWYRTGGRYRLCSSPYVFNINRTLPQLVTGVVWYGMVPSLLAGFTYRTLARPNYLFYGMLAATFIIAVLMWWLVNRRESRTYKKIKERYGTNDNAFDKSRKKSIWHYYASNLYLFIIFTLLSIFVFFRLSIDIEFRQLYLVRANLSYQDLEGANLRSADLRKACAVQAGLDGVDLSGANLAGSNFYGADFSNTKMVGTNLVGADISKAQGLKCPMLKQAIGWQEAVRDSDLTCGADLPGKTFVDPCDQSK